MKRPFSLLFCLCLLSSLAHAEKNIESSKGGYYLGNYPKGIIISYGAKSTTNYYQLLYYFVNKNPSNKVDIDLSFTLPNGLIVKANEPGADKTKQSYVECVYQNSAPSTEPFNPSSLSVTFSLPAKIGATCSVYLLVWADNNEGQTSNQLIVNATGTGNTPGDDLTTQATIDFADGSELDKRTITFKNNCNYDVYWGLSGASIQAKNKVNETCNSDDDCFKGSKCIKVSTNLSQCFWMVPTASNYQLKKGQSADIDIPIYYNGINLALNKNVTPAWGAKIFGRTGCKDGKCTINDCSSPLNVGDTSAKSDSLACTPGGGFSSLPMSQAEVTFQTNTPIYMNNMGTNNDAADTYNLSMIDGITIPLSISPKGTAFDPNKPYSCGAPGLGSAQQNPLGACSWQFEFNQAQGESVSTYRWVTFAKEASSDSDKLGKMCNKDSDCDTSKSIFCGLMYNKVGSKVTRACGYPIGYDSDSKTYSGPKLAFWSANKVCAADKRNALTPFNSTEELSQGPLTNLYGCDANYSASCYDSSSSNCCGCADWFDPSFGIKVPTSTEACNVTNPDWVSNVQPQVTWMKKGCPTSYVYPYDDKSSTFTCLKNKVTDNKANPNLNTMNYIVEFCPQGSLND